MSHVPLVSSYYNIPVDDYYTDGRRRAGASSWGQWLCCCVHECSFFTIVPYD
ncbi:hypothetical protein Tcan_18828 [Toxocara canis]|uniref:Uncharacterized protein n=1 Tax=Toxocara canis TaxID=6265 RepID=A0A0B2VK71_TOXCA|nr:hypothetical protein Tcan_18828 [Toxocara canis]